MGSTKQYDGRTVFLPRVGLVRSGGQTPHLQCGIGGLRRIEDVTGDHRCDGRQVQPCPDLFESPDIR